METTLEGKPWLKSVFTVSGYSLLDGLALPNRALVVAAMKPFDERKDSKLSVFYALEEMNAAFSQIASANIFAFNLPPIMGWAIRRASSSSSSRWPGAPPTELAAVARGVMAAARDVPQLASVFTTYGASTPQINLKLDRERAQALGVGISDIFSALQTAMGGSYNQRLQPVRPELGRSRSRPRRPTAPRSTTSTACACAPRPARWCPCRRWPTSS